MSFLIVQNLRKSFARTKVIRDISFEVQQGEFCILLGPSGCGKTTILRLIAGLENQDGGEIYINGREVSNLTPRQRDVAMVFQSYALYPHLSVRDNMAFSLRMQKKDRKDIDRSVTDIARLLGLESLLKRKPRELSGGQRQRVAIGRAIVRNPSLFLFDEPLSNLDAKLRGTMRVELAKLHQQLQATTVYVTHDQVEAMTLGQKIILFDQGKIQQVGTPSDVYNYPSNLFVASFIGTPQINLISGFIEVKNGSVYFRSTDLLIDLGTMNHLRRFSNQEIVLGIRPESLVEGKGPITGEVELAEHLGSETLLYVSVNGTRFIVKVPAECPRARGETISLLPVDTGMHFFYRGQRLDGETGELPDSDLP